MIVTYLMNFRLQWGKRDNHSLLPSALNTGEPEPEAVPVTDHTVDPRIRKILPPLPENAPRYFTADTPSEYISIIQNDWPYSGETTTLKICVACKLTFTLKVPPEVEHTLIWTRIPVFHEDLIDNSVAPRITQDGLWGFTGNLTPPPSPSTLPTCLPALADWGITMDKLIRSQKGSAEEEELVRRAGAEIDNFVRRRWSEDEWETAWFVNPPVSIILPQSSITLLNIHSYRGFKVCLVWLIYTSLHAKNTPE